MTAIAACTRGPRVWMAGDACVSLGDGSCVYMDEPKVFSPKKGLVVGSAGGFDFDRIAYRLRWTASESWIMDGLPAEATRQCTELGLKGKSFQLLVGFEGKLYLYQHPMLVRLTQKYGAIGCGAPWCIGYMAGSREHPSKRVVGAVKCAATFSEGVGGKISCVDG